MELAAHPPAAHAWSAWRLAPSVADLFFAFLLLAGFGQAPNWQGLLSDGDTAWHIRTGQSILETGVVPVRDPYSFSRAGEPWYAWEWLADAAYASVFRWGGLAAAAGLAAAVICLTQTLLFAWLLRRGAGLWISLAVALAANSAASVHYLARPHVFSLLLLTAGLWILDEDRRQPGRLVWWLVPMAALWANLHAGFVAWLAILGLLAVVYAVERNGAACRRYSLLAGLSAAATLANPYGWRLHQHIARYLGSSWIQDNVQEFQSPSIRSENTLVFAALLLAGVALAARGWTRHERFERSLVMVWGLAALRSARHIPLYAIVAAPVIAGECARWWKARAAQSKERSAARLLWDASHDWGMRLPTAWTAVLGAAALLAVWPRAGLADFPEQRFPVAAVNRNLGVLAAPPAPHILTSDQWADYLIFRLYPRQRVFFDGRSDFYGPALGRDYQVLLGAGRAWRETMARYDFRQALLPVDWPLGVLLEHDPDWALVYRDARAVLLVRRGPGSG
jgi:hypothetical protein